jgi:uncharacterized protein
MRASSGGRCETCCREILNSMNVLKMTRWSPYAAGACIGILSWFAFVSVDKPIGVSTAIAKTAGMAEKLVATDHVTANAYFTKFKPAPDWEWMLMIGLALGALLSSRLSGDKPAAGAPARAGAAFVGGILLMLGARIAGGCTSGHGISGSLQLALSGWVFFATIFVSGMATAFLMGGKEQSRG